MKVITLTITQEHYDFMMDNCIIISVFFKQKVDKLMENRDKFDKI